MTVELYSAKVCPFAHRTRLTLLEKGIQFSLTEIDLENKPDWFLKISPYQKVPVIKNGEDIVWESAIINEYLDEVFPTPFLMPKEPGKRALARIWIDFANAKFITAFYKLLLNQDTQEQEKWKQQFINHLLFMEQEGLSKLCEDGPYWLGESLSLIDLTFYPWFERWPVVEYYRGLSIPPECDRLQKWCKAMSERETVKSIANKADFYLKQYEKYANNTVSSITAQEIRNN